MAHSSSKRITWEGDAGKEIHFIIGEISRSAQLSAPQAIKEFRESFGNQGDLTKMQQDALLNQLDLLCTIHAIKSIFVLDKETEERQRLEPGETMIVQMAEDEYYELCFPLTDGVINALPMSVVQEITSEAASSNIPFVTWLFPSRIPKPETRTTGI